jgi:hypothetical protein
MRVMAEGQPGYTTDFSSNQFELVINENPVKPEMFFTEQVHFGDSMERVLNFVIDPGLGRVELSLHVGAGWHAEIPLDLSAPAE